MYVQWGRVAATANKLTLASCRSVIGLLAMTWLLRVGGCSNASMYLGPLAKTLQAIMKWAKERLGKVEEPSVFRHSTPITIDEAAQGANGRRQDKGAIRCLLTRCTILGVARTCLMRTSWI